jgi:threonine dehydrogenase-like Zn-dependent dehydrogenase
MKTKAVRIYGKNDLRLEEFELPALKDDEILAHVISDSICMSSYKAAKQGADHKRVPNDVAFEVRGPFSGKGLKGIKIGDHLGPGSGAAITLSFYVLIPQTRST